MLEIKEIKTKSEIKEFVNFPLELYKGNTSFVPPLYQDEINIFKKTNIYLETCDQVFYGAYLDGKMVGRIQGIIQKDYNKIHNEKRVRFTRFDCINDKNISYKLFSKVTEWAKGKGMDTICGPLGYSDLEREGLLIEGFNERNTFEEQYNFDYYSELIEDFGFTKEIDWVESELKGDEAQYDKIERLSNVVLKRYKLHYVTKEKHESKRHYINRISLDFFRLLDSAYEKLYGVVPFTEKMKKDIIKKFSLFVDPKYIIIIANESEKGVAFGLCFPAIGEALAGTDGKLKLKTIVNIIKTVKHPKGLDLALAAVDEEYLNKGVNAPIMMGIINGFRDNGIEYMETNLNLEDNVKIRAFWKYFIERQHKRRRSYIKKI